MGEIKVKDQKYDRSILRKQRDKATAENERLRANILRLESVLTVKDNELRQAEMYNSEVSNMMVQNVQTSNATVKKEHVESDVLAPLSTNTVVKDEPEDEYVPQVATPVRVKEKRGARSRKLGPSSPDPITNTPSAENISRVTRSTRQRKK